MITVNHACDYCKHQSDKLIKGYLSCCKAYPDGIPDEYYITIDPKELEECANGYKWEEKKNK
ncbi:MAG: glutamyl-tRNA amidotransferase [Bacillota bacterium]|jgi:hypothetical protein